MANSALAVFPSNRLVKHGRISMSVIGLRRPPKGEIVWWGLRLSSFLRMLPNFLIKGKEPLSGEATPYYLSYPYGAE